MDGASPDGGATSIIVEGIHHGDGTVALFDDATRASDQTRKDRLRKTVKAAVKDRLRSERRSPAHPETALQGEGDVTVAIHGSGGRCIGDGQILNTGVLGLTVVTQCGIIGDVDMAVKQARGADVGGDFGRIACGVSQQGFYDQSPTIQHHILTVESLPDGSAGAAPSDGHPDVEGALIHHNRVGDARVDGNDAQLVRSKLGQTSRVDLGLDGRCGNTHKDEGFIRASRPEVQGHWRHHPWAKSTRSVNRAAGQNQTTTVDGNRVEGSGAREVLVGP